jgi:hypothetical protein
MRQHAFPTIGFIEGSVESWIAVWASRHIGSEVISSSSDISCLLRKIAAAKPFRQTNAQSVELRLSARGLRALMPALASALNVEDFKPAHILGDWKKSSKSEDTNRSMPVRYAGDEQRLLCEVRTREKLI